MALSEKATRRLRFAGYVLWFQVAFVMSLYLTFPVNLFKGVIVDQIETALGKGKAGRFGTEPHVKIESLSLWRLSGLSAKKVELQLGSKDPEAGAPLYFDELNVRVGLFGLLSKHKNISFSGKMSGGDFSGSAELDDKDVLLSVNADIDAVDIGKTPIVLDTLHVPTATGKLGGTIDLALGADAEKTGAGLVDLSIKGASVGPGELKLPALSILGALTIPSTDLGDINLKIPFKQGVGTVEKGAMTGKDIQMEISGTINLRSKIAQSRIDLSGWFMPQAGFIDANAKVKSALELGEKLPGSPLAKAKDEQGRFAFAATGSLGGASVRLGTKNNVNRGPPRSAPKKPNNPIDAAGGTAIPPPVTAPVAVPPVPAPANTDNKEPIVPAAPPPPPPADIPAAPIDAAATGEGKAEGNP